MPCGCEQRSPLSAAWLVLAVGFLGALTLVTPLPTARDDSEAATNTTESGTSAPPVSWSLVAGLHASSQHMTRVPLPFSTEIAIGDRQAEKLLNNLCSLLSYHDMFSRVANASEGGTTLDIIEKNINDACQWFSTLYSGESDVSCSAEHMQHFREQCLRLNLADVVLSSTRATREFCSASGECPVGVDTCTWVNTTFSNDSPERAREIANKLPGCSPSVLIS